MVAYSFNKQFIAPIIEGSKRQTIRAYRKRHARPGEMMQLYTAMRTKYCRAIGVSVCRMVAPITLDFEAERIRYPFERGMTTIFPPGLDAFAADDGFTDWAQMRAFWAQAHPEVSVFEGVLIRWADFQRAE